MPAISSRTWLIAGVSVLVIVAFGLGYLVGRSSTPSVALTEDQPAISASDMRGAFGNRPIAQQADASPHQEAQAGSLSMLVAGLEKKVAADPDNIDQQLLLARTYQELGERDKGLKLLRKLHQRDAGNVEIKVTLATLLADGSNAQELQEADRMLEDAVRSNPQVTSMARLYQGDIQLKQGNRAQALKIWKSYMAKLPAGSEQRALYQQRIAQASQQ